MALQFYTKLMESGSEKYLFKTGVVGASTSPAITWICSGFIVMVLWDVKAGALQ